MRDSESERRVVEWLIAKSRTSGCPVCGGTNIQVGAPVALSRSSEFGGGRSDPLEVTPLQCQDCGNIVLLSTKMIWDL